jgi:hypothetical protein
VKERSHLGRGLQFRQRLHDAQVAQLEPRKQALRALVRMRHATSSVLSDFNHQLIPLKINSLFD